VPGVLRAGIAIVVVALSTSCSGEPPSPLPIDESAQPRTPPTSVFSGLPSAGRPTLPTTLDVDGDGMVSSHTDALLILRYVAGFEGQSLIEGAVGPGCQRCTAEQIEAYIASL
jgi:hypothetical protein